MKKVFLLMIFISILCIGCQKKDYKKYSMNTYAMGTYINIDIFSQNDVDSNLFEKIKSTIKDLDKKLSINNDNIESEVDKINKNAGKKFQTVSKDTFYLIKEGKEVSKKTNNKLNIAIGPIVKLWNIGFEKANVPLDKDIKKSLVNINVDDILLDEKTYSIKLKNSKMMIDLGAIAKGYVADKVKDIIIDKGYKHAILNIGGNILCVGEKYNSNPYTIGIRDGNKSNEDYIGTIDVSDKSVVTSGIYERNFKKDGKLYHHILDSKTGYPVENNLLEVSIITDKSTKADALSTAVFSMGLEDGLKYINHQDGIEAILVTNKNEIYLSDNIKEKFELTSQEYVICN